MRIAEVIDSLDSNGYTHERQPIGLITAIALIGTKRLEDKPKGKPSSRTPLSAADTLRLDVQNTVIRLWQDAVTAVFNKPVAVPQNLLRHLDAIAPRLDERAQYDLLSALTKIERDILVRLDEERRDAIVHALVCPFCTTDDGRELNLWLRASDGPLDLSVIFCRRCRREWGAVDFAFLGRLLTDGAE